MTNKKPEKDSLSHERTEVLAFAATAITVAVCLYVFVYWL